MKCTWNYEAMTFWRRVILYGWLGAWVRHADLQAAQAAFVAARLTARVNAPAAPARVHALAAPAALARWRAGALARQGAALRKHNDGDWRRLMENAR